MTLIDDCKTKCAICGREHNFSVLMSTNSCGMDLDTRPQGMARYTAEYEIQYCENCHYANYDISEKPDWLDEKILTSDAYLSIVEQYEMPMLFGRKFSLDDEIKTRYSTPKAFLLSSYLHASVGDERSAGMLSLKAAWVFDDICDTSSATDARKQAAEYLSNYISQEGDNDKRGKHNIAIMLVDIYRRIGEFDKAKEKAEQLLAVEENDFIKKILQYQISLIDAQDKSCHSVDEVNKK